MNKPDMVRTDFGMECMLQSNSLLHSLIAWMSLYQIKGFQLSGSRQFVAFVLLRLAEGRQPWSSSSVTVRPQQELADAESGIWALAASQTPGGLILGGTEEGMVMAWDLRMSSPAWQVLLLVWLWSSNMCTA